jgi:hypothetical protein
MAVITELYNPQKIEIVKRMLEKQAEKSTPMAYEIFVDNFKVVFKTTDLSEFDSYEDFINSETGFLRINIYNTPIEATAHTKYVFEKKAVVQKGLGETEDLDSKIKEGISVERERWDKEQLIKELEATKKDLKEAQDYMEMLQNIIDKSKLKSNHFGKLDLGLLAGVAIEGVMRKNPQWLRKVPGLEGLAGAIDLENKEGIKTNDSKTEEAEVSFSEKKEASGKALSDEQKEWLAFGRDVAESFENSQIEAIVKILDEFKSDSSKLKIVSDLLNIPA